MSHSEDPTALEFANRVRQLSGLEAEPDYQVRLNLDTKDVEVDCPTKEDLDRVTAKHCRRSIARFAQAMDAPRVNLRLEGEIELVLPPELVLYFADLEACAIAFRRWLSQVDPDKVECAALLGGSVCVVCRTPGTACTLSSSSPRYFKGMKVCVETFTNKPGDLLPRRYGRWTGIPKLGE